jgi:hypothetical protein
MSFTSIMAVVPDGGAQVEADLDLLGDAATADDIDRVTKGLCDLDGPEEAAQAAAAAAQLADQHREVVRQAQAAAAAEARAAGVAEEGEKPHVVSFKDLLIDALGGADPWAACLEPGHVHAPQQEARMTGLGAEGGWDVDALLAELDAEMASEEDM